ncbi:MAG: hypothetical protein NC041_07490 [Bacteroides sp.]|nr:hypothetical protein [Prevotella sp.]MCM1407142.1 hypothetical protein [Treponema brennaborense]MCM1470294.1 hypothetical protein [Bacteroides sp.]
MKKTLSRLRRSLRCFFLGCVFLAAAIPLLFPQTSAAADADAAERTEHGLPDTFRGIQLGMPLNKVKGLLLSDAEFGYREERDVSMLPDSGCAVIETAGKNILKRCWFQFSADDELYIMIFQLNRHRTDHYAVFSELTEKYGEPNSLSPEKSVWKNDAVSLVLERPLTLKYISVPVFESLKQNEQERRDFNRMEEKDFLDSL